MSEAPQPNGNERVVPGVSDVGTLCQHVARYNLSLLHGAGKRVIDAACGSGYGSFLISTVAARVLGVDVSREAVEWARERFRADNLQFRQGDIVALDEPADVIISFETIEHLDDLDAWTRAVRRCLRPGGVLMFSVPLNEAPGDNPYHTRVFDITAARALFPELTRIEEVIQHGVNFYPLNASLPLDRRFIFYIGICRG